MRRAARPLANRVAAALFAAAAVLVGGSAARAVEFAEARHLLARTGFAPTAREIRALAPLSYEQAVDRILAGVRTEAATPPPAWTREPVVRARLKQMDEAARRAFRRKRREEALDLKAWWYREMVATPSPLTERMTLFWHNHFTSSLRKVRFPRLLYRQNVLLRRHALGNFRVLLRRIARDPAMLLYLDNAVSRRGKPNENFARELLELFTLGEGHYGEEDVKAAARAFTGWSLDRRTLAFRFRPRWHDDGVKTFLGVTGRLDGDDVIDIILERPETAAFVTAKMWRAFVSETPEPGEVERLARRFRESGYDIGILVRGLLLSARFRDPATRGRLVRSPVELLVGTIRVFGLDLPGARPLVRAGRRLGQDLFAPPNVKGWPGGNAWITSDTLLVRHDIVGRVVANRDRGRGRAMMGPAALRRWLDGLPPELRGTDGLAALLLPLPPVQPPPADAAPERAVARLLADPTYQLK